MKKLRKPSGKTIPLRPEWLQNPPEWLQNPDVILFVGDQPEPAIRGLTLNVVEGVGDPVLGKWAGSVFGRAKEEVRKDWEKVLSQMHFLLQGASEAAKGYELTELTFNLGFSGEGSLGFIAKAGATAGISVKFTRKSVGAQ